MGLGILLGAASLWLLTISIKKSKKANKQLTLGFTYTLGGK